MKLSLILNPLLLIGLIGSTAEARTSKPMPEAALEVDAGNAQRLDVTRMCYAVIDMDQAQQKMDAAVQNKPYRNERLTESFAYFKTALLKAAGPDALDIAALEGAQLMDGLSAEDREKDITFKSELCMEIAGSALHPKP